MPISVRNLESFGDVAAEDDAVLDYFLTTDAVKRIRENKAFVVLGRKGSGKTAIVRNFSERSGNPTSRSISLRGYPWNVHAQRADKGASEIEAYVSTWRYLIAVEIAQLALSVIKQPDDSDVKSIEAFLKENYGSASVDLAKLLQPPKLRLSKWSFEPTVLGNKLGGISLERSPQDLGLGLELNALTNSILSSVQSLILRYKIEHLFLHFDELDQGLLQLDLARRSMLVGLILAARAIRIESKGSAALNPVVYLRSDIWDELDFSDKNKITQSNALHLEWTSETLQALVNERLKVRLDRAVKWDDIAGPELLRGGQSKWNHVLARSFLRPRDIISYLNVTLGIAKQRSDEPLIFQNPDIVNAREPYSDYLKKELDDEILPHWQHWE